MRTAVVPSAATRELRRAVLRPAWPAASRMHGDDDLGALHIAALDGAGDREVVVGACVVLPAPYPRSPGLGPAWQLRGMATADGHRGQGVGAAVLAEALRQVADRGARLIWCQARDVAVEFYARHGFIGDGPYFTHEETGIVHRLMYRELSPAVDSSTG